MDIFPVLPTKHYDELRHEIRSGDILLCSGNAIFSNMIQQATNSIWSHVAFILRLDLIDRIMLLESVESIGVRTVTLSSYLEDYNGTGKPYPGKLMLARHQHMNPAHIKYLSKTAVDLLGHPYHTQEILHIAARISMYNIGFKPTEADLPPKKEFICSEYVHECFRSIGIDIPFDPLGFIAPADFARCSDIQPLCYINPEPTTSRLKEVARLTEPV